MAEKGGRNWRIGLERDIWHGLAAELADALKNRHTYGLNRIRATIRRYDAVVDLYGMASDAEREMREAFNAALGAADPQTSRSESGGSQESAAAPTLSESVQGERVTLWRYVRIPNDPWKTDEAHPFGGTEDQVERRTALLLPPGQGAQTGEQGAGEAG